MIVFCTATPTMNVPADIFQSVDTIYAVYFFFTFDVFVVSPADQNTLNSLVRCKYKFYVIRTWKVNFVVVLVHNVPNVIVVELVDCWMVACIVVYDKAIVHVNQVNCYYSCNHFVVDAVVVAVTAVAVVVAAVVFVAAVVVDVAAAAAAGFDMDCYKTFF